MEFFFYIFTILHIKDTVQHWQCLKPALHVSPGCGISLCVVTCCLAGPHQKRLLCKVGYFFTIGF